MAPLILVVDDEPLLRRVVARMVGMLGCRTIEAEGIVAARAALAAGGVTAVLSDIALGDGSGLDLAAALVAAGSPPIALMSGSIEALEQAKSSLGVETLRKPFDSATVRDALQRLGVPLTPAQTSR